ncbi:MAG TPA: glycosyltransferase [Candidatus Eremiobacteraceae bacterium]|nr:glycosyltransferase [Candidatus Eremiobacteraceae bacterium]
MSDASVVIATRNRAGLLRGCLERLRAQSAAGRFDVVVVDNGSTDETPAVIAAAANAGLAIHRIHVAEPNRGKARNAGIASASGAVILFCDDDTLPPRGWVEAHLAARAADPKSVVSGPIVNVESDADLPPPSAKNFSRAFFCTCNVSVARAELDAVGGFDERYDLYGWEDTDLGVRLKERSARRVWSWEAHIYHVKPAAAQPLDARIALATEKGTMAARFVRKSPTLPVRLATGAYAINFARAALLEAPPLRRWYARLAADPNSARSPLGRFAAEALVDAAYLDAMRIALRRDA